MCPTLILSLSQPRDVLVIRMTAELAASKLLDCQLPKGSCSGSDLFLPKTRLNGRSFRRPIRVSAARCSSRIHGFSGKGVVASGGSISCGKLKAVVSGDLSTSLDIDLIESAKEVIHFFRVPLLQDAASAQLLKSAQEKISTNIVGLKTEQCFNIGLGAELTTEKATVLRWLLGETYEPENLGTASFLDGGRMDGCSTVLVEVGPRLSFTTAWSTNAVSICQSWAG